MRREAGTVVMPLDWANLVNAFHLPSYKREVEGFHAWSSTSRKRGLSSTPSGEGTEHWDGGEPRCSVTGGMISEVSGTLLVLFLTGERTTVASATKE